MVVNVVLIVVAVATFIATIAQIRLTKRQPLEAIDIKAAEDLIPLVATTSKRLVSVGRYDCDRPDDELGSVVHDWKAGLEGLMPKLSPDLAARVAAMTTLMELSVPARAYEQALWMEICHWASANVRFAAVARARQRKDPALRCFPSADEVRQLLAHGQRLGSGLGELDRAIDAMAVSVIGHEEKKKWRGGLLLGLQIGTVAVLFLVLLFRTFSM